MFPPPNYQIGDIFSSVERGEFDTFTPSESTTWYQTRINQNCRKSLIYNNLPA
jgi:hypothetical protein